MAKLAGISDSAVLMAKAQLRNGGRFFSHLYQHALGLNAGNLAVLLNTKNVYGALRPG